MSDQRLIDANALYRDLNELATLRSGSPVTKGLIQAMHIVRDAPTVEVETVQHSHWRRNGECNECGEQGLYNGNEETVRSRFCPHCGAQMEVSI